MTAPDDIVTTIATLEMGDRPLDALQLLGLTRLLDSVATVAAAVERAQVPQTGGAGRLGRLAAGAAEFDEETAAVRRAIDPSGDINDRASQALRDIRELLRRQRARLRSTPPRDPTRQASRSPYRRSTAARRFPLRSPPGRSSNVAGSGALRPTTR